VSDVAAMGARPRLGLLSLMLPDTFTVSQLTEVLDGVAAMAAQAGVSIAGGNITRSPGPFIVDVALTGSVGRRKVLTRHGGRPGDALYVSGTIGAAAAGLGWLRARAPGGPDHPDDAILAACVTRHRRPEPRSRLGQLLGRTRTATACMDLSDGLADAVNQLASSSGTGAVIDAGSLPIEEAVVRWFSSRNADPVRSALAGGDDYELLFAVPPRHRGRLKMVLRQCGGAPVTRIGELTASTSVELIRNGVAEALPEGFTHF
jgi:thiamine-monophosphate kinase